MHHLKYYKYDKYAESATLKSNHHNKIKSKVILLFKKFYPLISNVKGSNTYTSLMYISLLD